MGVSKNRVLRRIFVPKRDEITGEWRRLQKEELYDLYYSPNVIQVIKSRGKRWVGHVALMGERRVYTAFWWGKLREGDNLEDVRVDCRVILKCMFKKWDGL
jgi:hypothetical protein